MAFPAVSLSAKTNGVDAFLNQLTKQLRKSAPRKGVQEVKGKVVDVEL